MESVMAPKRGPAKKLVNLAFRLKPVIAGKGGDLHFIAPVDMYDEELHDRRQEAGKAAGLEEIKQVRLELPAGLRSFFGPTIAQVLSQLPRGMAQKASAFKIELDPGYYSGEEGYVNATATFYKGALPQQIKDQPVIARGETFTAPIPSKPRKKFAEAAAPAPLVATVRDIQPLKPFVIRKPDEPGPAQ
jgi:hypothetical protein